jgi:hypothetical protein
MFCLFGTWGLEGLAIGDPAVAPQMLNNLFTIRLLPDARGLAGARADVE